ncbi:MAG: hypothetical protein V7603_5466 [Micromonosporaceae bacterium]|jgi:hypothetical protein
MGAGHAAVNPLVGTVITLGVAVFFLAMGAYGLAAPAALTRPFGIQLSSPEARSEVRAVYGGFGIAVGFLLIAAAWDLGNIRWGALTAVAVALLGMASGRLAARITEAPQAFYPVWFYFWAELTAAAMLLLAVRI